MKRLLTVVGASALVAALLVGAGVLLAREVVGPKIAEAAGFPGFMEDAPPEIRDLHNLPPEQPFIHFLGGQFRYTDTDNKAHTVTITPGTVSNVGSDRLTINPNDGGGSKTYNLTSETRIHTAGQRWGGNQSTAPKAGDKVVVVTLDNSDTARAVMIGGPDGFGPPHGPFRRG